MNYSSENFVEGKAANKLALQRKLNLPEDPDAPLFLWPSRLDPVQKGCDLLAHILYELTHQHPNIQIAIIANGAYQSVFHDIARFHDLYRNVAVVDFDDSLSHLGYAAADFMLMPSLFEPCGLPQMISAMYGTLSVVHDTGGLHDTIEHLDIAANKGNGFVFETFDPGGLRWAVDQAMDFHSQPAESRHPQIARVMEDGAARFNHSVTASEYVDIYEKMLQRPLLNAF